MSKLLPAIVLVLFIIVIILPVALVRGCRPGLPQQPPPAVDRTPIESPAGEIMINVFNHHKQQIETMSLEEYLVGVVAAEMPASFELEALKAQAVVARTYTVSQMLSQRGRGCSNHPEADICTDHTHCQAWETEAESLKKWPAGEATANLNKIRRAVRETAGKVAVQNGQPIDAVFHAACGGHTENSEDVWSTAMSYLRATPCPYCLDSRWAVTEHTFSTAHFAKSLLPLVTATPVSTAGSPLLGTAVRTSSGRIKELDIAGETVGGRDLRSALNLPSTNLTWRHDGDNIIFTARGYGHGVGLCQYGADGQAKAGKTYDVIVRYYYAGVDINTIR
jgi:stage II sporulation protein D